MVIAIDSLHNDFEITTASLFHSNDKNLEGIQQIVTSTKAAIMARQVIGAIAELIIMIKKTRLERSDSKLNEEYFNYKKKCYYARNC